MRTLLAGPVRSISMPEQETGIARESGKALAEFIHHETGSVTLTVQSDETGRRVEMAVPAAAVRLLAEARTQIGRGHAVSVVGLHAELSTQQAADLLGVSRTYFVKLLEQGAIPFRKVGEQRRVRYASLLRCVEEYQHAASAALAEVTAEAERLGLYS